MYGDLWGTRRVIAAHKRHDVWPWTYLFSRNHQQQLEVESREKERQLWVGVLIITVGVVFTPNKDLTRFSTHWLSHLTLTGNDIRKTVTFFIFCYSNTCYGLQVIESRLILDKSPWTNRDAENSALMCSDPVEFGHPIIDVEITNAPNGEIAGGTPHNGEGTL